VVERYLRSPKIGRLDHHERLEWEPE
jgi:hypothetical protein